MIEANKFKKLEDIEQGTIASFDTSAESLNVYSPLLSDISQIQPAMHEEKKNCCEKICNFLFNNYDLTKSEYSKLNVFRRECVRNFKENHEEDESLLKDVYESYKEINNNQHFSWKELGFQTDNPRTDFRAAGLLSLKFIHYFIWKYPKEVLEMTELEYFLFAVVSIRLCFLLKLFLNLVNCEEIEISLKSHKIRSCTRRQFKNFCFYLSHNENVFFVLLAKSVVFVKNSYLIQLDASKKELNFLLIDPIITRTISLIAMFLDLQVSLYDYEKNLDDILSKNSKSCN